MRRRGGGRTTGQAFLDGGGELARLIAAFDWAVTPLGPIEGWPQSLRTTVGLILRSPGADRHCSGARTAS